LRALIILRFSDCVGDCWGWALLVGMNRPPGVRHLILPGPVQLISETPAFVHLHSRFDLLGGFTPSGRSTREYAFADWGPLCDRLAGGQGVSIFWGMKPPFHGGEPLGLFPGSVTEIFRARLAGWNKTHFVGAGWGRRGDDFVFFWAVIYTAQGEPRRTFGIRLSHDFSGGHGPASGSGRERGGGPMGFVVGPPYCFGPMSFRRLGSATVGVLNKLARKAQTKTV